MKASDSENKGAERVARNEDGEKPRTEAEIEADASEPQEPQGTGFTAQLRQMMQRSPQGEARTNVKRDQLKIDRTKVSCFSPASRSCWLWHSLRCSPHPTVPGAES